MTRREASLLAEDDDSIPFFRVTLPHQCEEWQIVSEPYAIGSLAAEAVRRMDLFIVEAEAARQTLVDMAAAAGIGGDQLLDSV